MSLGDSSHRPGTGTDRAGQRPAAKLRALAHPIRLRILSLLTGAAMTAAEIARELDLTHANASYHVRQLAEVGQIEVVAEERIRGGVAKRYRYVL
ncbi:MAG TPA: helix-turn-helix domain-containing protein, partial [Micromonosporaceae bacterium]